MEPPREIRPRDPVPEEEVGSPLWGSLASLCSFPGLLAAQNSRRADPDFRRIAHLISNGHPVRVFVATARDSKPSAIL